MLTGQMLQNLDTFLIVGIISGIIFLSLVFIGLVFFFAFFDRPSKVDSDDLKELEEKLTLEIKNANDKALTAKERALLDMNSDIKYIRENIKENKK